MRAHNFKDLTSLKFHKWTVLSLKEKKKRDFIWNCQCECGLFKEVSSNSLRNGSKSCGKCGTKNAKRTNHNIDHENELIAKNVLARYKCQAISRGYNYDLSFEEGWKILNSSCFYCEKSPSSFQTGKRKHKFYYTGIDRVDNDKGYQLDNCVPCCKSCNSMKKSTSKLIIYKAYHFLFKTEVK